MNWETNMWSVSRSFLSQSCAGKFAPKWFIEKKLKIVDGASSEVVSKSWNSFCEVCNSNVFQFHKKHMSLFFGVMNFLFSWQAHVDSRQLRDRLSNDTWNSFFCVLKFILLIVFRNWQLLIGSTKNQLTDKNFTKILVNWDNFVKKLVPIVKIISKSIKIKQKTKTEIFQSKFYKLIFPDMSNKKLSLVIKPYTTCNISFKSPRKFFSGTNKTHLSRWCSSNSLGLSKCTALNNSSGSKSLARRVSVGTRMTFTRLPALARRQNNFPIDSVPSGMMAMEQRLAVIRQCVFCQINLEPSVEQCSRQSYSQINTKKRRSTSKFKFIKHFRQKHNIKRNK